MSNGNMHDYNRGWYDGFKAGVAWGVVLAVFCTAVGFYIANGGL